MRLRAILAVLVLVPVSLFTAAANTADAAGEYSKHFGALQKFSVAVAQAMPAAEYAFRPHPDHGFCRIDLAHHNHQLPILRRLARFGNSCFALANREGRRQLNKTHNSPDGRLLGREILLAMYVHVAHHRGQAEIYLRSKGIRPPSYMIWRARAVIPRRTGSPAAVWCRIARNESA